MKRYSFFISILFIVLTSCEYSIDYYFEVDNRLNEDVHFIFVSKDDPNSLNFGKNIDITISPNNKQRISSYWGGVGGRHDEAGDPYSSKDMLPPVERGYIQVFIGDILLETDKINKIRQREYWEYHPNGQSTTYVLVLTEELLEDIEDKE